MALCNNVAHMHEVDWITAPIGMIKYLLKHTHTHTLCPARSTWWSEEFARSKVISCLTKD